MTIEQIVALLLGIAPQARRDGLTQMARTIALMGGTEDEIKKAVGKITADQINDYVKDWRKDADKEITTATQTAEKNLRDKYDFVEKGKQNEDSKQEPQLLTKEAMDAAIAEAIAKAIGGIKTEQDNEKLKAQRRETIANIFAENVPAAYKNAVLGGFEGKTFADDAAFESYAEQVKTDASAFMQDLADRGLESHGAPTLVAVNEKTGVSRAVEGFIADQKAAAEGKTDLGGKKL